MLTPGSAVTPTLTLVRELGAGGMGSVWIAEHATLHTQVVVKFIHGELARNPESLQRFSREAASAANVKSPHVVQVLDHGVTADGDAYIAMELLEGRDLAAELEEHGAMSPEQVDVVIGQVCKALARAHEKGIVHRDIKPQNIFLCDVGSDEVFVKVLDFGIAKATQGPQAMSATKTGASMGTPYYMSPEQTIGLKTLDHRADVWAVGVVAYECLTGQRPFDAETIGGLAVAICSGPLPVPSRARPSLGPSIDAWFARACAREVGERYRSAKELADSLHVAVSQQRSVALMNTVPIDGALPARGSAPSLPGAPSLDRPPSVPAASLGSTTNSPVSAFPQGEVVVPGVPKRGAATPIVALAIVLLVGGGALFFGQSYAHRGAVEMPSGSAQGVGGAAPDPRPSEASLPAHPPSLPTTVVDPSAAPQSPRVVPSPGTSGTHSLHAIPPPGAARSAAPSAAASAKPPKDRNAID